MRFKRKYVVGFMLLMYALSAYGQPFEFQRRVLYETHTYKTFKVACDVEIDSLSPLDFVYLQAKPALVRQAEFSIKDDWLTITYTYPQQPRYERDYEFQMGKSVTNADGTTLYYHSGEEYYHLASETNENFRMDTAVIETYGIYNGLFDDLVEKINQISMAYHAGYFSSFETWGSKVFLTQESEQGDTLTEMEMDFAQWFIEIRTFIDGIHILTDRTEYKRLADGWIPKRKKMVSYSELPSGIPYQITETVIYSSYQVIDKNDNIIGMMNTAFGVEIAPNPADNHIILHFSIPLDEAVNIKIFDVNNTFVEEQDNYVSGDEFPMDITHLLPNMYTVLCTFEDKTAQANFVKDGIGQYNTPNPVNMNVQVFPNPAFSYIKVRFPLTIDADMQVKIMDAMNNVYVNNLMYVDGNILQVDVSQLPLGIYYIVCVNNDGTACAKFFKL